MNDLVESVTAVAVDGLNRSYRDYPRAFPFTVRKDARGRPRPQGYSLRYAAISQIGINRWLKCRGDDPARLVDLHQRIAGRIDEIDRVGDAALWVWASCEGGHDSVDRLVRRLVQLWQSQSKGCHTVELAWVLKAGTMVWESHPACRASIERAMREAEARLRALFSPRVGLFRRQTRDVWVARLGSRIACFADQVYPIVAYSHYGVLFEDRSALQMAGDTVETLCRWQGPQGQWWWHYDNVTGGVCEGYPVFSVHQHSMAPMAVLALDRATGRDHREAVARGLRWITGDNELGENLIDPEAGAIWRDIERRDCLKASRVMKAASRVTGWQSLGRLVDRYGAGLRVNRECRPYELGWILYAWADPTLSTAGIGAGQGQVRGG
jgi:hypothetical protein